MKRRVRPLRVALDYASRFAVVVLAVTIIARADDQSSAGRADAASVDSSASATEEAVSSSAPSTAEAVTSSAPPTDEVASSAPTTDGSRSALTDDTVASSAPSADPTTARTAASTTILPDTDDQGRARSTATTLVAVAGPDAPQATTTSSAPLIAIQTVPAIADVVVRIDGTEVVSDANGVIAVPQTTTDGDVELVGLRHESPSHRVGFTGWGDGDTRSVRPLATIDGPFAQVGFELSYLVEAAVGPVPPGGATVTFTSEVGPVVLVVGEPTWVVASRAVSSPEGIVGQQLTFTASVFQRGSTLTPSGVKCVALPMAVWQAIKGWGGPGGACT